MTPTRSWTLAEPGTEQLSCPTMARTQLSTFKFDKPPSTMSDQERQDLAEKIVDQWAEDLKEAPPTPTK